MLNYKSYNKNLLALVLEFSLWNIYLGIISFSLFLSTLSHQVRLRKHGGNYPK